MTIIVMVTVVQDLTGDLQHYGGDIKTGEEVELATVAERSASRAKERNQIEEERVIEDANVRHASALQLNVCASHAFAIQAMTPELYPLHAIRIGLREPDLELNVLFRISVCINQELVRRLRVVGRGCAGSAKGINRHHQNGVIRVGRRLEGVDVVDVQPAIAARRGKPRGVQVVRAAGRHCGKRHRKGDSQRSERH